jgi:Ca2+-binding RTX toxin-like protein
MTFAYQWQRCDATLRTCTPVAAATTSRLALSAADVGKRLRVAVTATNGDGTATATSLATTAVSAGTGSALGVRTVAGTARNDRLTGGSGVDVIMGRAGRDTIFGRAGNDRLHGEAGNDKIYGEGGNDLLRGGAGNDVLSGGPGNDTLFGEAGNDRLTGGPGLDKLNGGVGDDTVNSADGVRDTVDCGAGKDSVVADRIDVVRGCEKVTRRSTSDRKTASAFRTLLAVASWTSGLVDGGTLAGLTAASARP